MYILRRHLKGILFGIAFGFTATLLLRSFPSGLLIGVVAGLRYSHGLQAGEGKIIGVAVGGMIGLLLYFSSFPLEVQTTVLSQTILSSISPGDAVIIPNSSLNGFLLGVLGERFFLSLSKGECFLG